LYLWSTKSGDAREGFPNPVDGWIRSGAAIGDIDGDDHLDIAAATNGDEICLFDLSCSGSYSSGLHLEWPMFRCGAARTGCYYQQILTGDEKPEEIFPRVTMIRSVHPNPFNPSTRIVFDMRKGGRVRVAVYDATGRIVAVLADRTYPAGSHELTWNGSTIEGSAAASGVYFCRMQAGETVDIRKMVLLR
jgi:hypothetical protein